MMARTRHLARFEYFTEAQVRDYCPLVFNIAVKRGAAILPCKALIKVAREGEIGSIIVKSAVIGPDYVA